MLFVVVATANRNLLGEHWRAEAESQRLCDSFAQMEWAHDKVHGVRVKLASHLSMVGICKWHSIVMLFGAVMHMLSGIQLTLSTTVVRWHP